MSTHNKVHPAKDLSRCVMPSEMLLETVQQFSPKYHDLFQSILKEMFNCHDLGNLHLADPGPIETMFPALYKARIQARQEKGVRSIAEDRAAGKRIAKSQKVHLNSSPIFKRFVDIYKSFVFECIFPQFQHFGDLIFQAEPIIRIVLPGSVATSKLHADGDFWHQMNEINFWVPLTRVEGANSLWCESVPGKGEFHHHDLSCYVYLSFL
jgi:hypothetical protein